MRDAYKAEFLFGPFACMCASCVVQRAAVFAMRPVA